MSPACLPRLLARKWHWPVRPEAHVSQPTADDSAERTEADPLLLFVMESAPAAPSAAAHEIPSKINQATPLPEPAALVTRAETAERSLFLSRKENASLKRQLATLVTAATDNSRSRTARWPSALGIVAACLVLAGAIGWRFIPGSPPPTEAAPSQAIESAVTPPPVEVPTPLTAVATPTPLPPRDAPARSQERLAPEPRMQYVGTLSVDAVPGGGEVFINRKSVGRTPVRVTGLRAGSHLVWIEREGYRLWTRVVSVPADNVTRVSVALEADSTVAVRP